MESIHLRRALSKERLFGAVYAAARMLAAALKDAGVVIATSDDPAVAPAEASAGALRPISGLLRPAR